MRWPRALCRQRLCECQLSGCFHVSPWVVSTFEFMVQYEGSDVLTILSSLREPPVRLHFTSYKIVSARQYSQIRAPQVVVNYVS
jgi:hypothetical protein